MLNRKIRAASLLLVSATLLAALAACAQETPTPAEEPAAPTEARSASVKVVDAAEKEQRTITAENIKGVEKTSLNQQEIQLLSTYLTYNLADDAVKDGSELSIEEVDTGGKGKAFNLSVIGTDRVYGLKADGQWELSDSAVEPAPKTEKEDPAARAEQSDAEQEAAPATTALNSSQTKFDVSSAILLSSRQAPDVIGSSIANRLLSDINSYLGQVGVKITTADDVYINPASVEKHTSTIAFTVMAISGSDHVVMTCSYDTDTGRHAIVWQP